MSQQQSEYARTGVDHGTMERFKELMIEVGRRTVHFPERRGVSVDTDLMHAHGGVIDIYTRGEERARLCHLIEGLGTKNWIAEMMAIQAGDGRSYYEGIGIDVVMMVLNDLVAQGAMPMTFVDEVVVGHSDWFENDQRNLDLAESFYRGCETAGVALVAGETPAYPVLVNSKPPVKNAPTISGSATGVIFPGWLVNGKDLGPGDVILGARCPGMQSNGSSLVQSRALTLPDQFMTELPNGNTLGEEALMPTMCYVQLVEALLSHGGIDVHAFLPGTGSGVAKLAFDHRPYNYRVHTWQQRDELSHLFQFLMELGVSVEDMFTTFNMGYGYYVFVPDGQADDAIEAVGRAGYELDVIGRVEEGERKVIFEPDGWERMTFEHP